MQPAQLASPPTLREKQLCEMLRILRPTYFSFFAFGSHCLNIKETVLKRRRFLIVFPREFIGIIMSFGGRV
jgi:hypothetical protein